MEENPLTQQKVIGGEARQVAEASNENGRDNKLAKKHEEKKLVLEGEASDQTKALTKITESMLWGKSFEKEEKSGQGLNMSYMEG